MQVATLVVLTGTFSVVTAALLIHENLDRVLTHWGDSIRMSVFLKEEDPQNAELLEKIRNQEGVENYEYISKSQAAALFKEQVKGYVPDLFVTENFDNPLPASFEIKFSADWSMGKFSQLVKFAEELTKVKAVEDVSYGQGWVKNYASIVDKFNASSGLLILVLLMGSLFVIGNSIRSSINQRSDEIEVLELIGSTPWFIRAPYMFEGALMGLFSSVLALMATWVLYRWQIQTIDSGIGIWGGDHKVQFLSLQLQFYVVATGVFFGWLGSFLCVAHLSSGWIAQKGEV